MTKIYQDIEYHHVNPSLSSQMRILYLDGNFRAIQKSCAVNLGQASGANGLRIYLGENLSNFTAHIMFVDHLNLIKW